MSNRQDNNLNFKDHAVSDDLKDLQTNSEALEPGDEKVDLLVGKMNSELKNLKLADIKIIDNPLTRSFGNWAELIQMYNVGGSGDKCLYSGGGDISLLPKPLSEIKFDLIMMGVSIVLNKPLDEVSIIDFCLMDPWQMGELIKLEIFEKDGYKFSLLNLIISGVTCEFKKRKLKHLDKFRIRMVTNAINYNVYGDDVRSQALSMVDHLNLPMRGEKIVRSIEELSPFDVYNILLDFVAKSLGKSLEETSFLDLFKLRQYQWNKFYFNCKGFYVLHSDLVSRLAFKKDKWFNSSDVTVFKLRMLKRALMDENWLNLKSELRSRVYAGDFESVTFYLARDYAYKICFGKNLSSIIIQDESSDFQDKLIQSISKALLGEHGRLAMQEADTLLGENVLDESTVAAINAIVLSSSQSMEDLSNVFDAHDEGLDLSVIELILSRDEFDQDQKDVFFNVLDEFYGDLDSAEEITESFVTRILNGEFGEFLKDKVLDLYEKDQLGDAAMLAVEKIK